MSNSAIANSQDNSTKTEIYAGVQITYRNKMHSIIMHNVIHDQISIVSGLLQVFVTSLCESRAGMPELHKR